MASFTFPSANAFALSTSFPFGAFLSSPRKNSVAYADRKVKGSGPFTTFRRVM